MMNKINRKDLFYYYVGDFTVDRACKARAARSTAWKGER
jgi:hypothetical protein